MKSFCFYYIQTFKNIVANSSVFTTLIAAVIMYSFFYPTAYKAQSAADIPIVIVDQEQSILTSKIISQVSNSPHVKIITVTDNFLEAKKLVQNQKAEGILLLPDNLTNSITRGEMGGIGLYLSTAYFIQTKEVGIGLAGSIEATLQEFWKNSVMQLLLNQNFLFIKFRSLIHYLAMAAIFFLLYPVLLFIKPYYSGSQC